MKQTNLILALLLVVSILYNGFQAYQRRSNTEMTPVMSYEEFSGFFEDLDENLTLKGYQNLGNNRNVHIVSIDKAHSFGKRSFLTLDDAPSPLETQQRIEYIREDGSELAALDLIYLESPVYEDLLYWNDPIIQNEENKSLENQFTDNILSYRNVLIKISVFSLSDGDSESINKSLIDITGQVVDFIQN